MADLMHRHLIVILLAASLGVAGAAEKPKQREVKVQKTSMSRDQEIGLGKQAAGEVERQLEVIKNQEIEGWLNKIGQKLAKTPQANAYPYYFKLVNEDSINAFALTGGPMYVHTGLIKTRSSYEQDPEQVVQLYTVVRPAGLWMFALAAPASLSGKAEPIFRQMIQTVKFAD